MSGRDLELIRAFRAEDAVVDADSQEKARAALLEHIDGSATGRRSARPRWRRPRVAGRIRADMVAIALAVLVVVGVGAAFLSVGSKRPQRPAHHGVVRRQGPQVIRNYSPGRPPALPGLTVCTAELTRPSVAPGGLFWPTTCQFSGSWSPYLSVGAGGSPRGMFRGSVGRVDGVVEYRFSITASGLAANTAGSVYAVWLLQAAKRLDPAGTYRLLEPQTPLLLGVIEPGVGRNGKLSAQGFVPRALLGSDYLLSITLQPNISVTTPGRRVLRGFVSPQQTNS